MHYLRVWLQLAKINFSKVYTSSRVDSFFLVLGKSVRFGFFLVFIIALLSGSKSLAGYNLLQVVVFFMTFNLIDLTTQFFLRGIYNVRRYMQLGIVDLALTQPVNFFFRIASDWIDFLDLLTLIPVLVVLGYIISSIPGLTLISFALYILLIVNALLIAFSIHLVVLGITLVSEETSGEIWIYRDIMTAGRFPIDIFPAGFRIVLTYVLPIGIMISFPTKVLIGALSLNLIIAALAIGAIFYLASNLFFRYSLRHYSSISS